MGDDDAMIGKLKLLGVFLLVTFCGLFKGCTDIQFAVRGTKGTATFMSFSKVQRRRGSSTSSKYVRYRFVDKDGDECTGYDIVPMAWMPPNDHQLAIVYLRGRKEVATSNIVSRLQESSRVYGIVLFVVGLTGTVVTGYFAFRIPVPNPKKRRRRS